VGLARVSVEADLPRLFVSEFHPEFESIAARARAGENPVNRLAILLAVPAVAAFGSVPDTLPVAETENRWEGRELVIGPATRAGRRLIEQWCDREERRPRLERAEPILLPSWATYPANRTSYQAASGRRASDADPRGPARAAFEGPVTIVPILRAR
jgi:hypothetical protein